MDQFVAPANIDHFLEVLSAPTSPNDGSVIHRLLLEEENKLARDRTQLEFVELKVARHRNHHDRMLTWRDGFEDGSPERQKADAIVERAKATLYFLEEFCGQMRRHVNGP